MRRPVTEPTRRAAARTLLATLAVAAGGCGARPAADPRPLVAVSVPPQAWLVERIAGDAVRIAVMLPPGASPATHEPTLQDLAALDQATLYVEVGHDHFPFERAWLRRLLAERRDLPVVDCARGLDLQDEDPHLWLSPRRTREIAARLAAALAELRPDRRAAIDAGLAALVAEVDAVDADLRAILQPARGRRFLVFHPAWAYLAADYGLVQLAIEQHGKEPDARALGELIATARAAGFDTVFAQPHFSTASVDVLAAEIGARVELLDPLAYDWSDNLRRAGRAIARAARP